MKNLVEDAETELNQLFVFSDSTVLTEKISELKKKFMSVSRSLEIMKKKIVSLKAKNLEISNNFVLKDQCFHNLKSQLGKIKDYNKKNDSDGLGILEINKEMLKNQVNQSEFCVENFEIIKFELENFMKKLKNENSSCSELRLYELISESKRKSIKLEENIEELKQKYHEKKFFLIEN